MPIMPGRNTLLIDPVTWDFVLDLAGNWAIAEPPYAIAQDAATAIRLFINELWYDTTQGLPYWAAVLGKWPPISLVKAYLVQQALTVPGTESAIVFLTDFDIKKRRLSGQVQVTSTDGTVSVANF